MTSRKASDTQLIEMDPVLDRELPDRTKRTDPTVMDLMEGALSSGASVEAIERLVALKERMEDRAAERAFADAFAQFQAKCPPIRKSSVAKIATKGGASFAYRYAELDEIARTVNPILSPLGFSYTWDSKTDGSNLTVRCTLRHREGHRESATFTAPIDGAARMSGPQAAAASNTFAKRQSLVQVLGLTTTETDTDASATPGASGFLTDKQVQEIEALIEKCGADRDAFLRWMNAPDLCDIRASDYGRAVEGLKAKQQQKNGGAS